MNETHDHGHGHGHVAAAASASASATADRKRISRSGQALEAISRRLIDLTYPPGSSFTESELAKDLGLTKTPVREALLVLASNGLVYARPGAGYLVMPITLKDIRSLCRHWRRLEGDAAAMAAGLGLTGHHVMHMSELVTGEGDFADISPLQRNTELHLWIVEVADDPHIERDFRLLALEIERLLRLVLSDQEDQIVADNPDILRAVLSGSPESARQMVIAHVDRIEKMVIDTLLSSDILMSTNLGLPGSGR